MDSVRLAARALELQSKNIPDAGGGSIFYQLLPCPIPTNESFKANKEPEVLSSTLLPKFFVLEKFSGNGMGCFGVSLRGVYLVSDYNTQSILWF